MQEEVKVEVHESDPIALEQEIPFFVIPDHIHKEATREYEPPKVENQSVTSIHVDAAEIENSNKDATSLKKQAKRNQRAVRWNPAPKKRRYFNITHWAWCEISKCPVYLSYDESSSVKILMPCRI